MKSNKYLNLLFAVTLAVLLSACSSRVAIENVDFAQPVEIVAAPDGQGQLADVRTGVSFSVLPLLEKEGISFDDFAGTEVRMIRNHQGYYFVTAAGFRNVYVMESRENELRSKNIIRIDNGRLSNPALNQRNPHIQLIDGDRRYNLSKDGIRS